MNRFPRAVLPALAALLLGAASSQAQNVPSSYRYIEKTRSVNVYAGYLHTSPELSLPDSQSAALGPRSAPIVGVGYAMRVGGPLSIEANLAFSPTERDLYDGDPSADSTSVVVTPTGERVSDPLLLFDVALRFHLTGDRTYHGLAPFVVGSGGLVAALGSESAAESAIPAYRRFELGPSFAVGTATGVDFFPSQRLSLRAELSYRLWKLEVPTGLLPSGSGERSEWSANTGVSLGAAYHF